MRHRILISVLIATAANSTAPVSAQPDVNHNVITLNFDLWCQQQAALPPARCDKRTLEDESAFEAHQAALEHYEIPDRSVQYEQGRVNRDIMNIDPIDNPQKNDLGPQQRIRISPPPIQKRVQRPDRIPASDFSQGVSVSPQP